MFEANAVAARAAMAAVFLVAGWQQQPDIEIKVERANLERCATMTGFDRHDQQRGPLGQNSILCQSWNLAVCDHERTCDKWGVTWLVRWIRPQDRPVLKLSIDVVFSHGDLCDTVISTNCKTRTNTLGLYANTATIELIYTGGARVHHNITGTKNWHYTRRLDRTTFDCVLEDGAGRVGKIETKIDTEAITGRLADGQTLSAVRLSDVRVFFDERNEDLATTESIDTTFTLEVQP